MIHMTTQEDRENISKAAQSVLTVLANRFEAKWNPAPIVIGVASPLEEASLDFLCNLGLAERLEGTPQSVDYVFEHAMLFPPASAALDRRPALVTLGLTKQVRARIVQEGAERFVKGSYEVKARSWIQPPGPSPETDIVAPLTLEALDEMSAASPTGELFVINAITYADIRMFGREQLDLVSEAHVVKAGILAIYKKVAIRVSRACHPDEVLLLDGRGEVVARRRVCRL